MVDISIKLDGTLAMTISPSFQQTASSSDRSALKIDLHVHVVGNGAGGTGCWYRPRGWTRWGEPWMLRGFGLRPAVLREDLDQQYAAKLRSFVVSSSLDAAVILAQDDPHQANGEKIVDVSSFYVPNDYVLSLARSYPEFLAGISIHPARRDALEELERCLAAGAVLLKCLPNCQNIDWSERRYTRFLERMAEAGLPLLAHTGGEHTLPVIDKRLADPRVLTRPLEIGVTCIAAHCGTASWLFDHDYFQTFAEMMERCPNLYGDNSAFSVPNGRIRGKHLARCLEEPLRGRILHGSDAPVPVLGHEAYLRGYVSRRAFTQSLRQENPLERDYQLKRAMGFDDASFTRASTLLRFPVNC
ncbi:MAG: amidohydrolase family protein [Nibricoccus sp.]